MVKLRLKRIGRRNRPCYRLEAKDSRLPRDGRALEELGLYDPLAKSDGEVCKLKKDRIEHWLSTGAQPSETVARMLKRLGIGRPAAK